MNDSFKASLCNPKTNYKIKRGEIKKTGYEPDSQFLYILIFLRAEG
jgi:hypothetical protein